jgi:hypothetical protein
MIRIGHFRGDNRNDNYHHRRVAGLRHGAEPNDGGAGMTENTIVEREYYAIETRDERRQRWYRDDGEYDSVEELKEHWEELITEGVTKWRIVKITVSEVIQEVRV